MTSFSLGGENLAAGLNGESLFLFAGDQKDADAIYANPLLAHLPAVQNKQVYALGNRDVPSGLLQRHASAGTT
ncbi:ferrienterobactin-binding periplasmic protein [Escherichia coli]|uniref:Ferrienterobactin-binding periplasmic protein n=1 Tax=Escherichia coli TaxID=562 RepID=A0A376UG64_ECOLX|nr:ferrienterobactin-binding periplasmic protein [Escherichia coli]